MILQTIIFKREKESKVEVGIEIEGGIIIDTEGKVVLAPIYNAKGILGISIDLEPIFSSLSKIKFKL